MRKIIIAIDGHSSCGKSTMAKALAKRIGYTYVDTGAMYRAVTLFALRNGLIHEDGIDTFTLKREFCNIRISFKTNPDGSQSTLLNGENVEKEIRGMAVSEKVSPISALDFVRSALTAKQREMGVAKGVVMDGRDIGTAVYPDAELKVFVTASDKVRAQRRYDELKTKGTDTTLAEVLKNVQERDYIDSHREIAPLRQADDAIVLDNSNMTFAEQDEWLYSRYLEAAGKD